MSPIKMSGPFPWSTSFNRLPKPHFPIGSGSLGQMNPTRPIFRFSCYLGSDVAMEADYRSDVAIAQLQHSMKA
jgi:hypothetical protein